MTITVNYLPKQMVITPVVQLFKVVFNALASLHRSYQQARKASETIQELSRLSNSELMDIGLTRGDIYSIAHETMSDYSDKINTKVGPNQNLKGWV